MQLEEWPIWLQRRQGQWGQWGAGNHIRAWVSDLGKVYIWPL